MAGPESVSANLSPEFLAQNNSAPLLETCIAFLFLETLFMILLFTSRLMAKEQHANVYMIFLMTTGYFTCCAKIALGILAVEVGGAGRHMAAVPASTRSRMLKIQTALQIVCPLTTSITKLSILCLLHQILGRTSKKTCLVIKTTFILVLAILIAQVIIPFANCKPFSKTWNPTAPGSCGVQGLDLWRYLSIPNVLTTFIIIGIPLPALYKLKVNATTKLGLGVVFTVCVMGVVAAIMRFQSFLEIHNFDDITYETVPPLCWTIAESGIYLVAGVLPTLRPLLRKIFGDGKFDRLLSRSLGKSSGSWGNKRASRFLGVGKPLPPLPPKSSIGTSEIEHSKGGESRYSQGGSARDSVHEERALAMARV